MLGYGEAEHAVPVAGGGWAGLHHHVPRVHVEGAGRGQQEEEQEGRGGHGHPAGSHCAPPFQARRKVIWAQSWFICTVHIHTYV